MSYRPPGPEEWANIEEMNRMARERREGEIPRVGIPAMPPSPKPEIFEQHIAEINLRFPAERIRPYHGEAKWFRDELGQIWVKFKLSSRVGVHQDVVVPSDRVADVRYLPRT